MQMQVRLFQRRLERFRIFRDEAQKKQAQLCKVWPVHLREVFRAIQDLVEQTGPGAVQGVQQLLHPCRQLPTSEFIQSSLAQERKGPQRHGN